MDLGRDLRHGKRTIAVVTGSRADYGIYLSTIKEILNAPDLRLRLMVCGAHLSDIYNQTVSHIEADGIPIADRIETLGPDVDSPLSVARAMARGVSGFAAAFARDRPDILLVLGDRYEMWAAAIAALPFAIPLAHIHGGELTEGAIDDAIRHSLTKMSHLHFVSTSAYRDRIVQLGEGPDRVFVTGAPGLDAIRLVRPKSRSELEDLLNVEFDPAPLLVTFHPVTLEYEDATQQMSALTAALSRFDRPILFTYPNADTGAGSIVELIDVFVATTPKARVVKHLGAAGYFGMMAQSAAMVGNSSSGMIEAMSFGLPVVNIGNRQRGRLRAANVIDCTPEPESISVAITRSLNPEFRCSLANIENPFGDGRAAQRIVSILRETPLDAALIEKRFFDLPRFTGSADKRST